MENYIHPLEKADFYKYGHKFQYPEGTEYVYSNLTCRKSRVPGVNHTVFVGLQMYLKQLIDSWNNEFFNKPWKYSEEIYNDTVVRALGPHSSQHFQDLHSLGYLPLEYYALPEGTSVPIGVPSMVVVNTHPKFGWLTNFLETDLSYGTWGTINSSTLAKEFRKIGEKWAKKYYGPDADLGFINWQFHDFSMRGMFGLDAAVQSGLGHLTQFTGTDTAAAIRAVKTFYGSYNYVGGSVPSTEHSVMCAGGKTGEFNTFRWIIETVYPEGVVSIVSDTWDLWKVLTEYLPKMKETILARNGKVVIRPDSCKEDQTPVHIICGDSRRDAECEKKGVIRLLNETFGNTDGIINKAGCIYGDGMNIERTDKALSLIVDEIKLSPYNLVIGVGSYYYQYNTRDTFGQAIKATEVVIYGEHTPIFKDPITDSGMKKSGVGIITVHKDSNGELHARNMSSPSELLNCEYNLVMHNGVMKKTYSFDQIRSLAQE